MYTSLSLSDVMFFSDLFVSTHEEGGVFLYRSDRLVLNGQANKEQVTEVSVASTRVALMQSTYTLVATLSTDARLDQL